MSGMTHAEWDLVVVPGFFATELVAREGENAQAAAVVGGHKLVHLSRKYRVLYKVSRSNNTFLVLKHWRVASNIYPHSEF